MRHTLFLVFIVANFTTLWSQCKDDEVLKIGGDFQNAEYISHCPTYTFAYGGINSKKWSGHSQPIDIELIGDEIFPVKENLENKLKTEMGEELFSKMRFQSVSVSVYDSISKMKSRYPVVDMYQCKTKYFFFYHLEPVKNVKYCIGIALDDYQRILSDLPIPTEKENQKLDPVLNVCKAIELAKATEIPITPIESVYLDFDSKRKAYFWIVKQQIVAPKYGENEYNEVRIEASDAQHIVPYRKTVEINAKTM